VPGKLLKDFIGFMAIFVNHFFSQDGEQQVRHLNLIINVTLPIVAEIGFLYVFSLQLGSWVNESARCKPAVSTRISARDKSTPFSLMFGGKLNVLTY
jgi:hypothetical protein